jgi:hypothetical protein
MKTRSSHSIKIFSLLPGILMLFAQTAWGGEFVIMNKTYTYPANGGAFDCNTRNYSSMPSNWKSPDDYWNGQFYGYFELIDIPSNQPVGFQMGIYQYYLYNGKDYYETCSLNRAELQGKGDVAEINFGSPSAWWQHPNGGVDFTKPNEFEEVGLAIWSHMTGHKGIICPTSSGGDDIANEVREYYMPCTIRVIIVAVSAGSTFSGWSNYLNGGCTPVQQPTPTYSVDLDNLTTNKVVPSTDEYSYNANMSGAISGNGQKLALTLGQTVYFRTKKVSDCLLASNIQTLVVPACVPTQQTTPTYGIDYTMERTDKIIPATDEYSINSNMAGAVNGTGQLLTLTPGTDVYFRTRANGTCLLASNIQHLAVPARPAVPSVSIDYLNERTAENIGASIEYSASSSYTNPVTGSGNKITLTPGQDLYFWQKATGTSFYSLVTHLVVPDRPATPSITIDYADEKTSPVPSTLDWSTSASMTPATTGTNSPVTVIPGTDLYIRVMPTSVSFASAVQSLNVPDRPAAPTVSIDYINEATAENIGPTVDYSISSSYTNPITGDGNKITLTPGQNLYFWVNATATSFYSLVTQLVVPIRPATPSMTIDFSTEKTSSVPSTLEWSTSVLMTSPTDGTNAPVSTTPGTDLFFRTKPTGSSFRSQVQHLVVDQRPATPLFHIDYENERTSELINSSIEYSAYSDLSEGTNGSGEALTLFPGQDQYFRVKATDSSFNSLIHQLNVPPRPNLEYSGEDTISQTITLYATLDESMTGFDLSDVSVTNGFAQNLQETNSFEITPQSPGEVHVIIPANAFAEASFVSNEVVVFYEEVITGTTDLQNKDFSIYPNPNRDGLVQIRNYQKLPFTVTVLTVNGKIVRNMSFGGTELQMINLHDLNKGAYLLKIHSGTKNTVHKLILE